MTRESCGLPQLKGVFRNGLPEPRWLHVQHPTRPSDKTVPLSLSLNEVKLTKFTMTLKLQRVNLADFELMSAYTNTETGDLVAPGIASCWPSPSSQRTQFSIQRELDVFHNDASVRFVKVVNNEDAKSGTLAFLRRGIPCSACQVWKERCSRMARSIRPHDVRTFHKGNGGETKETAGPHEDVGTHHAGHS
jgi:hypothetical protein